MTSFYLDVNKVLSLTLQRLEPAGHQVLKVAETAEAYWKAPVLFNFLPIWVWVDQSVSFWGKKRPKLRHTNRKLLHAWKQGLPWWRYRVYQTWTTFPHYRRARAPLKAVLSIPDWLWPQFCNSLVTPPPWCKCFSHQWESVALLHYWPWRHLIWQVAGDWMKLQSVTFNMEHFIWRHYDGFAVAASGVPA